jgi:hypothetical protein
MVVVIVVVVVVVIGGGRVVLVKVCVLTRLDKSNLTNELELEHELMVMVVTTF